MIAEIVIRLNGDDVAVFLLTIVVGIGGYIAGTILERDRRK